MTRKALAPAVLVVSGLVVGAWFGLVKPAELEQQRLIQTQAVRWEQLEGDLASTRHLGERRKELDALEQRLCEQVSSGHRPRDPDEMIALLTDLSASSGVSRAVVIPGKEEASPFDCGVGLVQTHFSVSGQATFAQARALFGRLESQRFLLRPADIRWDSEGQEPGPAQMTIDVVHTHFRSRR